MIDTMTEIRNRLAVLNPMSLELDDESSLHAGHEGARGGGGHYRLRIVCGVFAGIRPLARHRLIHEALGDLMQQRIHALRIEALAPTEIVTS